MCLGMRVQHSKATRCDGIGGYINTHAAICKVQISTNNPQRPQNHATNLKQQVSTSFTKLSKNSAAFYGTRVWFQGRHNLTFPNRLSFMHAPTEGDYDNMN